MEEREIKLLRHFASDYEDDYDSKSITDQIKLFKLKAELKKREREAKEKERLAIEADKERECKAKEKERQAIAYAKDIERKFEIFKMELAAKLNVTSVNTSTPKKDEFNV